MSVESKGTLAFVSLGCPKNLVDSERMLGKLAQDGYTLVPDAAGADVVVVNTCGFIESARQESLGVIREMLARKERGDIGAVVVAGCLAERKKDELLAEVPGVDAIVGVFGREEIAQVVGQAASVPVSARNGRLAARPTEDEHRSLFRPAPVKAQEDTARLRITPRHYAYLKISEGCDRTCTFCAIPGMRGKHVTKPMEEVIREARELAADGVRELVIVAQDTTYYGLDLYGRVRLAELLRELETVNGIEWIRIMYAYPIHFNNELIDTLIASKKIIPYLDLPLQHINDRVLKRMQRRVRRQDIEELLTRLRSSIPNLTLRTTFITGFPGETEAEFQKLVEFIGAAKFERAGVFTYSFEPGTPATKLDGHLPEEVKEERRDRLMRAQQQVALAWAQSRAGQTMEVIVDGPDPDVPNHLLARSHADAPQIDCLVRVKGKGLRPGDIIDVKITGGDGYDLLGRAVGKPR
ncbi:MAG: 30S ribosomal protein S12 methylthiotransferase RimO [Planctomycetes bacterium]|nr:30S ribosomal protein S12 methylthiotransferase RimO [Planctomycetota bacterium]